LPITVVAVAGRERNYLEVVQTWLSCPADGRIDAFSYLGIDTSAHETFAEILLFVLLLPCAIELLLRFSHLGINADLFSPAVAKDRPYLSSEASLYGGIRWGGGALFWHCR
jgi:hypothetical protein